jgi:hypothetical protein
MTYFLFEQPEYTIPSIANLKSDWANIADTTIRKFIATENQYLTFHRHMILGQLKFKKSETDTPSNLILSVRAGAIKSAILMGVSIIEAALRFHFEANGGNGNGAGLGKILRLWPEQGLPRLACWSNINVLRDFRNNIHLYKAAETDAEWATVIAEETSLLDKLDVIFTELQALKSPLNK